MTQSGQQGHGWRCVEEKLAGQFICLTILSLISLGEPLSAPQTTADSGEQGCAYWLDGM